MATTRTLVQIPLAQIVIGSNDRRRFDAAELRGLAASIAAHGLIEPIVVRGVNSHYEVVAGERRLRACQSLGWSEIPALVELLGDRQASAVMLAENGARVQLDCIEEGRAYGSRIESGWSIEECATTAGVSAQRVRNRISLLTLRDDIQAAVATGQFPLGYAQTLAGAALAAAYQGVALRIFNGNPSPTPAWWRAECAKLAESQNQVALVDSLWLDQIVEQRKVGAAMPPLPGQSIPPNDAATTSERLTAQIAFWRKAAQSWAELGKVHERRRCDAAADALTAMLDTMQAGDPEPSTLFDAESAATFLAITRSNLKYHVRRGNLRPAAVPGVKAVLLFERSELERFKVARP